MPVARPSRVRRSRSRIADAESGVVPFAEFFAGIGLMRLGLERADPRFRCVFANDLDPVKRRIYQARFSGDEVNASDVHQLDPAALPDVDLATASFPCTDLSLAGAQRGLNSGESSAFWGFHKAIEAKPPRRRPKAILLENVVGLLASHDGDDFLQVLQAMNRLGYRVDPLIVDARWFVPQSRARLFVVCRRDAVGKSARTEPDDARSLAPSRIRPARLIEFMRRHADEVCWSVSDPPDPPARSRKELADVVRDPPNDDDAWWSAERVDYLYGQMFPRHQAWINERRHDKCLSYGTAFRRVRTIAPGEKRSMAELRTDGLAGCLRTPKGGSGRQILVRVGRGRLDARLVSAAECAGLMGAEGYEIAGTLNEALFGFGDAVCVDAVAWIARHCLAPALTS